jgi:hypothetical protein
MNRAKSRAFPAIAFGDGGSSLRSALDRELGPNGAQGRRLGTDRSDSSVFFTIWNRERVTTERYVALFRAEQEKIIENVRRFF